MRQSQSCDACRARKVRCARENPEDPKQTCKHCIALGIPCTYEYQPKKRGPPNLYLRRLQEAAAAAAVVQQHESQQNQEVSVSSIQSKDIGSSSSQNSVLSPSVPSHSPTFLDPSLESVTSISSSSLPPSRYPIAADTFQSPYQHQQIYHVNSTTPSLNCSQKNGNPAFHTSADQFNTYPLHNWPYRQHQTLQAPFSSVIPPLNYYHRPHRLEDVVPRDTVLLILALFFDYVYPLTPCLHKPSFMADVHARREEHDPLFFALVMSTVASTLIQVPRSYIPMERHAVRKLAQACHEASRYITVATYDPPSSTHVVIRYFDCVYHFCEGHDATQHAALGEACHIAITLRMHEESSYESLDPIEAEVRRRAFWLLFGADKSESILLGRPICLRDEDCTVHFPKELDDEYITATAYLPQPHGKTAIVSGLNYTSRIFALLGEILVRIRVDKRSPPQGQFATARLEEVQALHSRIMAALAHAPECLRLKPTIHTGSTMSGATGGGGFSPDFGGSNLQAAFDEVRDFFDNPKASRTNALNPYLVMQANLYVTQQLVRFVIEQYRDELITSLRGSLDEEKKNEDREVVVRDLLNILHSIPIQSIATNGPSLVHKVRFVASTLLDAVRKPETAPASAARAHGYLWDFLSILSEIERNYLLDDDRDVNHNGDGNANHVLMAS